MINYSLFSPIHIGFSSATVPLDCIEQPNVGAKYTLKSDGTVWGPQPQNYGVNQFVGMQRAFIGTDVIGCGVIFETRELFYTKNGQRLG